MEECKICSRTFSSKSTLKRHTMTSKNCKALADGNSVVFSCTKPCPYTTTLKSSITKHIKVCKVVYVKEQTLELQEEIKRLSQIEEVSKKEKLNHVAKIKDLNEKIKVLKKENVDLKLQLEEKKGRIVVYKERPGTINNTQYINPKLLNVSCDTIPALTIENVKKEVDAGNYTYDDYIRGEIGLVHFISTLISSDEERNYVCTDVSRNKFHLLLETREWKEDNGANFLKKIFDQLKEPATTYYEKVVQMASMPGDSDLGDFIMDRTKRMYFGIVDGKSRDRATLFNNIRTEVRKLAAI